MHREGGYGSMRQNASIPQDNSLPSLGKLVVVPGVDHDQRNIAECRIQLDPLKQVPVTCVQEDDIGADGAETIIEFVLAVGVEAIPGRPSPPDHSVDHFSDGAKQAHRPDGSSLRVSDRALARQVIRIGRGTDGDDEVGRPGRTEFAENGAGSSSGSSFGSIRSCAADRAISFSPSCRLQRWKDSRNDC